jgi:hypothetical protein
MVSIITNLLPLFAGFISGIFKFHLENKSKQQEILLQKLGAEQKGYKRAANIKDKGISWTRRTIALIFTIGLFSIIGAILLIGSLDPQAIVNVPVEGSRYSILSILGITSPTKITDYIQLQGIAIVMPLIEPIIGAVQVIVGFYFGSARTR